MLSEPMKLRTHMSSGGIGSQAFRTSQTRKTKRRTFFDLISLRSCAGEQQIK